MPPIETKTHPIPSETPRFLTKRPSTVRHLSQTDHDLSFDAASQIFLTSTQPVAPHVNALASPAKGFASFNKNLRERYGIPKRSVITPKKNPATAGQDPDDPNLAMSIALLETKDEHGNPLVRAIRKLETNRFHTFLNKYKQDEEIITNKISQMKTLELDLRNSKIKPGQQLKDTGRKVIQKLIKQQEPKVPISELQHSLPTANDSSTESFSPMKQSKEFALNTVSPALEKPSAASHIRTRSAQVEVKSPSKPQSAQGMSPHRPKTPSMRIASSPKRPQTVTGEGVKYGVDTSGLMIYESMRQDTESSQGEKRHFITKSPLFRSINFTERESQSFNRSMRNGRSRPRSHILEISLNDSSSPSNPMRDKMSVSGYDKWSAIHSKREIDTAKLSMEKSKRDRTRNISKLTDLVAIKEWFNALTVRGNPVTPLHDLTDSAISQLVPPQKDVCHNRRQKILEKLKNHQAEGSSPQSNKSALVTKGVSKPSRTGQWGKQEGLTILEKMLKGQLAANRPKSVGRAGMERGVKDRRKAWQREKKPSMWTDSSSKAELEGWNVPFINDNVEKEMHVKENTDIEVQENGNLEDTEEKQEVIEGSGLQS